MINSDRAVIWMNESTKNNLSYISRSECLDVAAQFMVAAFLNGEL